MMKGARRGRPFLLAEVITAHVLRYDDHRRDEALISRRIRLIKPKLSRESERWLRRRVRERLMLDRRYFWARRNRPDHRTHRMARGSKSQHPFANLTSFTSVRTAWEHEIYGERT